MNQTKLKMKCMKHYKINSILVALAIWISAIGLGFKILKWTGVLPFRSSWSNIYFSHSIAESKEMGVYICRYELISGDLSYPSESLYIPPIKEAFAEYKYLRFRNKNSKGIPYTYKIIDDYRRVVVIFDDSIKRSRSYYKWDIKQLGGFFPKYSVSKQTTSVPDTLVLDLYYYDRSIPDSLIEVPIGNIKLKRMD